MSALSSEKVVDHLPETQERMRISSPGWMQSDLDKALPQEVWRWELEIRKRPHPQFWMMHGLYLRVLTSHPPEFSLERKKKASAEFVNFIEEYQQRHGGLPDDFVQNIMNMVTNNKDWYGECTLVWLSKTDLDLDVFGLYRFSP